MQRLRRLTAQCGRRDSIVLLRVVSTGEASRKGASAREALQLNATAGGRGPDRSGLLGDGRRIAAEVTFALPRYMPVTIAGCLLVLLSAQLAPTQEIPRVITVQDAMRLALERNPSVRVAESGATMSEAALEGQRARRLPTFSAGASGRVQQSLARPVTVNGGTVRATPGIDESSEISVGLRHVFIDSGRSEAIAAAGSRLEASEASVQNTRRTLMRSVASAYFTILAGQEFAEVAQQAVSSAELTLELVEARIEAGTAAEVERLPVEADLARARYEAVSAENTVWQALAELRALLALPPDVQPLLRGDLEGVPAVPGLDEWLAGTMEQRPDLEAQRHRVRAAELAVRQREIDAGFTYSVQGQADYGRYTGTSGETWQVAAGVSFPLFDRGSQAAVDEARANLEQTVGSLEELELAAMREVTQAWHGLRDARDRVLSAMAAHEAAQSSLEVARARYGEGVATIIEVTDAELQWRRSSATLVQARYDRVVAYYQLLAAGGHPLLEDEAADESPEAAEPAASTVVPE